MQRPISPPDPSLLATAKGQGESGWPERLLGAGVVAMQLFQGVSALYSAPAVPIPSPLTAPERARPLEVRAYAVLPAFDPAAHFEAERTALLGAPPAAPRPTVEHVAGPHETLAGIAMAHFGDARRAEELGATNGLEDSVAPGSTVVIPLPSQREAASARGVGFDAWLEDGASLHEISEGETIGEIAYRYVLRRFPEADIYDVAKLIVAANAADLLRSAETQPQVLRDFTSELTAGRTLQIPDPEALERFVQAAHPPMRPTTASFVVTKHHDTTLDALSTRYRVDLDRLIAANPEFDALSNGAPVTVPALRPTLDAFHVSLPDQTTVGDIAKRYALPVEILIEHNAELGDFGPESTPKSLVVPAVRGHARGASAFEIVVPPIQGPAALTVLRSVAHEHDTTLGALLAANGIDPSASVAEQTHSLRLLLVGPDASIIRIPRLDYEVRYATVKASSAIELVARIEDVAEQYGIPVDALIKANLGDSFDPVAYIRAAAPSEVLF